jgi:hypothetical protein
MYLTMTGSRLALASLAAMTFLAGCMGSVVTETEKVAGSGAGKSTGTTSGASARTAAWREADKPIEGSVGSGGTFPDDNAIRIWISSDPLSCGAPYVAEDCGNHTAWELHLSLPPARQHPGVMLLGDPDLFAYMNWAYPVSAGTPNCAVGYDLGIEVTTATVEIVAIDADSITLRFHDVVESAGQTFLDGADINTTTFVVPRCH